MALGMQLAGPSTWRRNIEATNVKAFVTHYGAPPKVCSAMWFDIESSEEDPLGQWDKPLYLLLALRFLKAYPTDAELCAFFDINSRITITKWRNIYVNRISKLLLTKVRHMKLYLTLLSRLLILCSLDGFQLERSGCGCYLFLHSGRDSFQDQ
jgi:hypothetical protein